jgi:hypothetical protein
MAGVRLNYLSGISVAEPEAFFIFENYVKNVP